MKVVLKAFAIAFLFLAGLTVGAVTSVYFLIQSSKAEEPVCSLESAFKHVEKGETAYCKNFRLYRRGDGSFVVYSLEKQDRHFAIARR